MNDNIKTNSIIIAIAICLNYVVVSISGIIQIPNLLAMVIVLLFAASLYINRKINQKYLGFIAITMLLPISSLVVISLIDGNMLSSSSQYSGNNDTLDYFMNYILNGILLTYCVTHKFEVIKVLKYIMLIYTFFVWGLLLYNRSSHSGGDLMGWSYAIIPVLLASLYIVFFSKEKLKWKIGGTIILIIYGLYSASFFTRGGVLACFVFVFILIIHKNKIKSPAYFISRALFFIVICILIINYENIILNINTFLLNKSINVSFFEDMAMRISANTVDSGRSFIYEESIKGFQRSPILGNGLAAFARQYASNYDHNIFLQLLNEGGILFGSFHFILIIWSLIIVISWDKKYMSEYKIFIIFLICNSLIRLCFSYILWREQGYWMMIYLIYTHKYYKQEVAKIGELI